MAYGPVNVGGGGSAGGGTAGGDGEFQKLLEAAQKAAEEAAKAAEDAGKTANDALSKAEAVEDALSQSGGTGGEITLSYYHIGPTAPVNTKLLWIDTSADGTGGLKYHDGEAWKAVPVVWG